MHAIQLLEESRFAFTVFAGVLGLLVGSFLNVAIYRLPLMLEREWTALAREQLGLQPAPSSPAFNLMFPHSTCPHCNHRIRAWENIPVLSYVCLRGRCSGCDNPIGARYPLVEIASGVLSAAIAFQLGFSIHTVALMVLTWCMLVLSMIDLDHQLLPDPLIIPLLWLGLLVNSLIGGEALLHAVVGAVAGYLSLFMIYWLFKLITGKDGLGGGDFKMLAMIGAWGGYGVLPFTILISAALCVLVSGVLLAARRSNPDTPVSYGPYLAFAGWLSLIWGEQLSAALPQLIFV